jgi:integrase/recombinase XerC
MEVGSVNDEIILQMMPYRINIANNNKKTVAKKISIVRSFVKFLKESGYKVKLLNDESIKTPKTLPKPVEYTHIKEALRFANEEEELIVLLLYGFGLRISELSRLKIGNIKNEWVRVTGKGDKTRNIPVLPVIKIKINSYLEKNSRNIYIFEKNGKRLSENSLRYKINKIFKRVGLKVTPHQLRHSYASDMLNRGGRITDVSRLLGHSSLSTTEIYTKLDSEYKLKNYKMAHPLSKKEIT